MFAVAALHSMKSIVPFDTFHQLEILFSALLLTLLSRATVLSAPLRTGNLTSLMRPCVPVDVEIVVVVGAWNRKRNTHIHIHTCTIESFYSSTASYKS